MATGNYIPKYVGDFYFAVFLKCLHRVHRAKPTATISPRALRGP